MYVRCCLGITIAPAVTHYRARPSSIPPANSPYGRHRPRGSFVAGCFLFGRRRVDIISHIIEAARKPALPIGLTLPSLDCRGGPGRGAKYETIDLRRDKHG